MSDDASLIAIVLGLFLFKTTVTFFYILTHRRVGAAFQIHGIRYKSFIAWFLLIPLLDIVISIVLLCQLSVSMSKLSPERRTQTLQYAIAAVVVGFLGDLILDGALSFFAGLVVFGLSIAHWVTLSDLAHKLELLPAGSVLRPIEPVTPDETAEAEKEKLREELLAQIKERSKGGLVSRLLGGG